jgi:signal transduction histidine kinase
MLAPFRSSGWIAYGVAVISILVAWALRFALDPVLGDHASFGIFFLAVAVAAWFGGAWPAIATASVSCLVGNYFFTHPQGSFAISTHEELYSMLLFLAVSAIIGVLSETSLRALDRARRAERAKDDFMATVAHEMRSPLSVIHYATALTRLSGPEESRNSIELIDRQVKHLDVMIQDLLDVSRVARGKIRLERREIDASAIVQGALEKARPLVVSRKQTLAVELSPEPMPLYVDPVRMEQVLTNLLTNAAKYTPNGGQISLSARPLNGSAVFAIRDNGIGISAEMLPRVFDLFVQANPALPESDGGLGIGLALVRKLVEMHDGSVVASSQGINQGSEFVVTLPMKQPAAKQRSLATA